MCKRRRSADLGGLHLAVEGDGHGRGWLTCDDGELHTRLAELLSDMYTHTLNTVNDCHSDFEPATLSPAHRQRLITILDSWKFQPHELSEDDLLSATLLIFEAIFRIQGMQEAVGVSMEQLSPFIYHLRRLYRIENSYHNYEHALDVLQATHSYLQAARIVPSLRIVLSPHATFTSSRPFDRPGKLITSLNLRDIFALYIAAIGHDVGHPGLTNLFMNRACSPLSLVFEGKSALEQMHCQLLLHVMRLHGLGHLLDDYAFRRIVWYSVMATDMSVHQVIMGDFEQLISETDRVQGPVLMRKITVCQVLLKCADISNPSRPFEIAAYWANALGHEWTCQAMLEQRLALAQTVQPSDNPLSEAKGQIFFTKVFAGPLLDLALRGVPEMKKFVTQCQLNLETWQDRERRLAALPSSQPPPTTPSQHPDALAPAFPLKELKHFNSQCHLNFEAWRDRKRQVESPPSAPSQNSDECPVWLAPYQGAFPLTLPTAAWNDWADLRSTSGSTSSGSGDAESAPTSPSSSSSISDVSCCSSTPQAPRVMRRSRPPSQASSSGGGPIVSDYASIRSAAGLGVRKSRKHLHRNSWCPDSSGSMIGDDSASLPPPPPTAPTFGVASSPMMPVAQPPPASAPMQMQTGTGSVAQSTLQLRVASPRGVQGLGFKGVGGVPKVVVAGAGVASG